MNRIISSLLIFSWISLSAFAQDQEIKNIDKYTSDLNINLCAFQKIEKYKEDIESRYVYSKDNEIQLITLKYTENNIEKNVAWYYSKGQLIYSEQTWVDVSTKKILDHQKFYLSDGHLVSWMKNFII